MAVDAQWLTLVKSFCHAPDRSGYSRSARREKSANKSPPRSRGRCPRRLPGGGGRDPRDVCAPGRERERRKKETREKIVALARTRIDLSLLLSLSSPPTPRWALLVLRQLPARPTRVSAVSRAPKSWKSGRRQGGGDGSKSQVLTWIVVEEPLVDVARSVLGGRSAPRGTRRW